MDGITDLTDMSLGELWELVMGGLACCSPWGCKESDTTERLTTFISSPCSLLSKDGNIPRKAKLRAVCMVLDPHVGLSNSQQA